MSAELTIKLEGLEGVVRKIADLEERLACALAERDMERWAQESLIEKRLARALAERDFSERTYKSLAKEQMSLNESQLAHAIAKRDIAMLMHDNLAERQISLGQSAVEIAKATGLPEYAIFEPGAPALIAWIEGVKALLPDDVFFADTGLVDLDKIEVARPHSIRPFSA